MLLSIKEAIAQACGLHEYISSLKLINEHMANDITSQAHTIQQLRDHLSEVEANSKELYKDNQEMRTKVTNLEVENKNLFEKYDRCNTTVADINAHHEADLRDKDSIIADQERQLRETQNKLHSMTKRYNTMVSKYNVLTKSLKK